MYEKIKAKLRDCAIDAQEKFLLEKANEGSADAMYLLGKLYFDNHLDAQLDKAFKWFALAAEKDQADATYYLGEFYAHGFVHDLTTEDVKKANEYYEKALALGSIEAMREIAWNSRYGFFGVEKDEIRSIQLLENAAKRNDAEACYWLAGCYRFGKSGVEVDKEKALSLAFRAFEIISEV